MKCPNCGKTFEDVDVMFIGTEEYNCKVYFCYETHCPNCNRDWHWENVYEYTETTIPYQINPNDHL